MFLYWLHMLPESRGYDAVPVIIQVEQFRLPSLILDRDKFEPVSLI